MYVLRNLAVYGLTMLTLLSCASGPPSYEQNIQSAISGGGNVSVHYTEEGVVVLSGWVEDIQARNQVYRAALKGKKVDQVRNLIRLQF